MLRFRVLSALALCAAALASTSTATAQVKVGVVNFQKAISDTAELKKAQNDLIAKFKPRQDELDKANRDLNDLQTQLQSTQGKLSPSAQADLEARAQRTQRLAERINQDLQDDVQKERDETIQRLGSRMTEVVKKLMGEKGLDAILDSSALVSFKDTLEITADATAAYDKAYPVKP
jgi:outer membrane protein